MDIKEEVFRENYLFAREDILKSLELFIEHERLNEETAYSSTVVENRVKLCEKFVAAVKKAKLPVLTELWWYYEYQFLEHGMELNLCQADELEIENDDISSMTSTVERTLISVECDYLTVEEYAIMHDVDPVTVKKWIRRGKLRHAKKNGGNWLIPDTEDKPRRGFDCVHYLIENKTQIESDEFPLLAISESISIYQDENNKNQFVCYLRNYKNQFNGKMELTRNEVERLEYTIIESGKAKIEASIQYVPYISRAVEV